MPVDPPDAAALAAVAQRYGLGLTAADLDVVRARSSHGPARLVGRRRGALRGLRARDCRSAPGRRPDAADNPFNAWYVTTRSPGPASGPLAGRTVAVKDNTAVAGVPMMNGSETMEGYVPRRDATVVSRVLAAGATITGKAVCEDLCFSGGSHTSRTGPVRNPWDETRSAGGSSSGSAALVAAGHRRRGHRRRPGRLGADPRRLLRHRRAQADLGPGPLHRRVPDRADDRPPRPDDPHRRRRRAGARRDRRPRRARPAPAPRPGAGRLRRRARPGRRRACGSASSPRASATPTPTPGVDDAVRAAIETCCAAPGLVRRGRLDPVAPARRHGSGTSSPPRAPPPRWSTPTATA